MSRLSTKAANGEKFGREWRLKLKRKGMGAQMGAVKKMPVLYHSAKRTGRVRSKNGGRQRLNVDKNVGPQELSGLLPSPTMLSFVLCTGWRRPLRTNHVSSHNTRHNCKDPAPRRGSHSSITWAVIDQTTVLEKRPSYHGVSYEIESVTPSSLHEETLCQSFKQLTSLHTVLCRNSHDNCALLQFLLVGNYSMGYELSLQNWKQLDAPPLHTLPPMR